MTFCQQADPEKALDFGISIENFMYCDNIRISRRLSMMSSDIIHVELQDTKRRSLIVNVKVSVKPGGSLRVSDLIQKKTRVIYRATFFSSSEIESLSNNDGDGYKNAT